MAFVATLLRDRMLVGSPAVQAIYFLGDFALQYTRKNLHLLKRKNADGIGNLAHRVLYATAAISPHLYLHTCTFTPVSPHIFSPISSHLHPNTCIFTPVSPHLYLYICLHLHTCIFGEKSDLQVRKKKRSTRGEARPFKRPGLATTNLGGRCWPFPPRLTPVIFLAWC